MSRPGAKATIQRNSEELKNIDSLTGVDDRDAQIAELQGKLDLVEARLLKSRQSFKTWRERIRPIARQFRQQRKIISELRDELRRRDVQARQAKESQANVTPESAPPPKNLPEKANRAPKKSANKTPHKNKQETRTPVS